MTANIPADNVLPAALKAQADELVEWRIKVDDAKAAAEQAKNPHLLRDAQERDLAMLRQLAVKGKPMPEIPDPEERKVLAKVRETELRRQGLAAELADRERAFSAALADAGGEHVALCVAEMDSAGREYQATIDALLAARQRYMANVHIAHAAILADGEHRYYQTPGYHFEHEAYSLIEWTPRIGPAMNPKSWTPVDGGQIADILHQDSARHLGRPE